MNRRPVIRDGAPTKPKRREESNPCSATVLVQSDSGAVLAHCVAVREAEKPSGSRQTEARRTRETGPGYSAKKKVFLVLNGSQNEEGKMAACFVPEQKTKTGSACGTLCCWELILPPDQAQDTNATGN
jgi:hypothetical protein